MSDKKKTSTSRKNEKNDMTNIIIAVITAVIIVATICIALVVWKTSPSTQNSNTIPQVNHEATPEEMIKTYDEVSETGTVSKSDSKVYNYFMSHYQDDYYLVNEVEYSIVDNISGQYSEYYETHIRAYSSDGYLYSNKILASYDEKDYTSSSEVVLRTPEKNYLLYPDFKHYMEYEATPYTNTISFPVDEFKTGTIKINGRDYYYEEYSDNSITYRYCFDENNELLYNIASSSTGTITTRYIEYSKNVDYSLFEIPEGYTLVSQ